MKLRGAFITQQVVGEIIALPTGETAQQLNGMILLNEVSKVIWDCLSRETTPEQIVQTLLQEFAVSEQEAREDVEIFLSKLRQANLLDES